MEMVVCEKLVSTSVDVVEGIDKEKRGIKIILGKRTASQIENETPHSTYEKRLCQGGSDKEVDSDRLAKRKVSSASQSSIEKKESKPQKRDRTQGFIVANNYRSKDGMSWKEL